MGLLGQGALAIWNDVAEGADAEFNRWHLGEHMAERVAIPGFLRGRRYDVLRGAPRYFTLYETERPEVLNSPAYLARLNAPTPWTQKCIALFRNNKRTACRVTATLGAGIGGTIATLDVGPAAGRDATLRAWLTGSGLPALLREDGVTGAHLLEADPGVTRVQAAEKKLLDRPDAIARWVVLVEASDADALDRARDRVVPHATLVAHGAASHIELATYRLAFALGREG